MIKLIKYSKVQLVLCSVLQLKLFRMLQLALFSVVQLVLCSVVQVALFSTLRLILFSAVQPWTCNHKSGSEACGTKVARRKTQFILKNSTLHKTVEFGKTAHIVRRK